MSSWAGPITAITVFADDLATTKAFYHHVFDLDVHYEDDVSVVFKFGDSLINLLSSGQAPSLITPAIVADQGAGSRIQFTLEVPDVDATCVLLAERGVTLLNGPMDRPWGIRTASFLDPAGQIWEIAH